MLDYMLVPRRKATCRHYAIIKLDEARIRLRDIDSSLKFCSKVAAHGETLAWRPARTC